MAKTFPFTGADGSALDSDLTVLYGAVKKENNKLANDRIIYTNANDGDTSPSIVTVEGSEDDSLSVLISAVSNKTSGIPFRIQDADNYWLCGINGTGLLRVIQYVSGEATVKSSYQIASYDSANEYKVGVSFVGRVITVELDDTEVPDANYTHTSDYLITETKHGIQLGDTATTADDFTVESKDSGAAATTSTLNISTSNNLPASGSIQYYVHKVSDKSVMQQGSVSFTNGNASIELPLSTFPVGTAVHWQIINPAASLEAGAQQDTE